MFGKLFSAWKGFEAVKASVLALYAEGIEIKEIANQLGLATEIVKFIVNASKETRS